MAAVPFDIVFCDTCIGGSTVASSLAQGRRGLRAFYLADYAVNPLGVKSHAEVEAALDRWVDVAAGRAGTMVVACNTASVRLQDRPEVKERAGELGLRVFSMVDLLDALIRKEAAKLEGRRICLMGTNFTVSQPLYRQRLEAAGAGSVVPLPATKTERAVAHLEHTSAEGRAIIREEIEVALNGADAVLLACTCFPLVSEIIRDVEPGIRLVDPSQGIRELGWSGRRDGPNRLTLAFTGETLSRDELSEQARTLFPEWEVEHVMRVGTHFPN